MRASKAAARLVHNLALTIAEIAVGCGYSSSSASAREFRQRFRVSAPRLRTGGHEVDCPADGLCYELYLNDPDQHPEKKHIVDVCEPVRKR